MTSDAKIQKFKNSLEEKLLEKFAKQKLNLGFEIVPGTRPDKIRVEIYNKKRPPTQFGKKQGAHTVSYSTVMRSLVWLLDDVTLVEARKRLEEFHWSLYSTYMLCVDSAKAPNYLDLLKELADDVHADLRGETKDQAKILSLIGNYLTLFVYLHNLLPDAAVNLNSQNRGEYSALNQLQALSSKGANSSKDKTKAMAYLSVLIDEETLKASLAQSSYMGAPLVGFQLMGINRLLAWLPGLPELIFGCDLQSPLLKQKLSDENLLRDLVKILFYKFKPEDVQAIEKREAQEEDQKRIKLVEEALTWIFALRHQVNGLAPYGIIGRA